MAETDAQKLQREMQAAERAMTEEARRKAMDRANQTINNSRRK